jgi:flagellar biosynthesis/type III secretory pathway protein FliH
MPEKVLGKKAVALGYRQGYAKGMQHGLQKGLQKGLKEGRRKGLLEGMRQIILRQMRQLVGPLPVALERRVRGLNDAKRLTRIAGGLLRTKELEQIKKLVA